MEKTKRFRTRSLPVILLTGLLIAILAYSIGELGSARNTLDQYKDKVSGMRIVSADSVTILESHAENLRKQELVRGNGENTGEQNIHRPEKMSMEEKTNFIRDLLRTRSVGIERFRINSRDGGSEFVLHCQAVPFFGFLAELEEKTGIEPDYINIKPDSGFSTINVTVRFNHVP